jgi:hypothetical protein
MSSIAGSGSPLEGRLNVAPITPVFQTGVIVAGNVVITCAVIAGLRWGNFKDSNLPAWFIVPELIAITVGILTAFSEHLESWLIALGRGPYKPSRPMKKWLDRRDNVQRYIVYFLSILVVIALAALVLETGNISASPFVPFLTAPALFGPFVAKGRGPVVGLVGVVALTIIILGVNQETKGVMSCKPGQCLKAERLHPGAAGANAPDVPATWLYGGVSLILIVVAGGISAARLHREGQLEKELIRLLVSSDSDGRADGAITPPITDAKGTSGIEPSPEVGFES